MHIILKLSLFWAILLTGTIHLQTNQKSIRKVNQLLQNTSTIKESLKFLNDLFDIEMQESKNEATVKLQPESKQQGPEVEEVEDIPISLQLFQNWYGNNKWGVSTQASFDQPSNTLILMAVYSTPTVSNVDSVKCILALPFQNATSHSAILDAFQASQTTTDYDELQLTVIKGNLSFSDLMQLDTQRLQQQNSMVLEWQIAFYDEHTGPQVNYSIYAATQLFIDGDKRHKGQKLHFNMVKNQILQVSDQNLFYEENLQNYQKKRKDHQMKAGLAQNNIEQSLTYSDTDFDGSFGTYKPYLIHGVTQKAINPLTLRQIYMLDSHKSTNFMRYSVKDGQQDNLVANFIRHDGRDYSQQRIEDAVVGIELEEHFVQIDKGNNESSQFDWVSLVEYKNDKQNHQSSTFVEFFYTFGMESYNYIDDGSYLEAHEQDSVIYVKDAFNTIAGTLRYQVLDANGNAMPNQRVEVTALPSFSKGNNWDVENRVYMHNRNKKLSRGPFEEYFCSDKSQYQQTIDPQVNTGTLMLVHFQALALQEGFTIIFQFTSLTAIGKEESSIVSNYPSIISLIQQKQAQFDAKFKEIFTPTSGFKSTLGFENDENGKQNLNKVSQTSLSNLLGGINWMFGPILVDTSPYYVQPQLLFSGTPARAGFPRGFLWDDGFHLFIICRWDAALCTDIIGTWLNTQFSNGWIAREQIRGEEIENYANLNFLVQKSTESNPPSFMLPISYLLETLTANDTQATTTTATTIMQIKIKESLKSFYGQLKRYHSWFQQAYQSNDDPLLFIWHSYDFTNYLDSGLDDFPRKDGVFLSQYQVDIQTWFVFFTETVYKLAKLYDTAIKADDYQQLLLNVTSKLYQTFQNEENGLFVDVTQSYQDQTKRKFSPHLGYISLFPFMFGLIDEHSPAFQATINLMLDPKQLWTDFGLRSLSKENAFFGKGSYYWRGPIWINLNYLVLRGARKFYPNNELAMNLYDRLKENIVRTVGRNFIQKGFFFENFNCEAGLGQDNHPFNGWTSLITLIMNDIY